jgi:hypothetical protein
MHQNKSPQEAIADSKFTFVMDCGIKIGRDENGCYLIVFSKKDKEKTRRFRSFSATLIDRNHNLSENLLWSEKEEWHLPKISYFDLYVCHIGKPRWFGGISRKNDFKITLNFRPE